MAHRQHPRANCPRLLTIEWIYLFGSQDQNFAMIGKTKLRTESSKESKLRRVVGHGTHEPVRRRLPHRVEQTAKDVEKHAPDIWLVVYVDALVSRCAGVLLLVKVSPDVHDEHHEEEGGPASVRANATRDGLAVEEETDEDRADDLGDPIEEIV